MRDATSPPADPRAPPDEVFITSTTREISPVGQSRRTRDWKWQARIDHAQIVGRVPPARRGNDVSQRRPGALIRGEIMHSPPAPSFSQEFRSSGDQEDQRTNRFFDLGSLDLLNSCESGRVKLPQLFRVSCGVPVGRYACNRLVRLDRRARADQGSDRRTGCRCAPPAARTCRRADTAADTPPARASTDATRHPP